MPVRVGRPMVNGQNSTHVAGIYAAYVRNWSAWQCDVVDYRFVDGMSKAEVAAAEAEARAAGKRLGDKLIAAGEPFGPITIRAGRLLSPAGIEFVTPALAASRNDRRFVITADDVVTFDAEATARYAEVRAAEDARRRSIPYPEPERNGHTNGRVVS